MAYLKFFFKKFFDNLKHLDNIFWSLSSPPPSAPSCSLESFQHFHFLLHVCNKTHRMKIGLLACIYTNMSSHKIMDNIVIIPLKNNDPSQLVCRSHVISREQCFTAPQQSLALPLNFSKGDGIGSPFVAERAFSNYCQYFDQLVESVCTSICTPQKLYFSEKAKNIPVL